MRQYIEKSERQMKKTKEKHRKSLRAGSELTRLANIRLAEGLATDFDEAMSQLKTLEPTLYEQYMVGKEPPKPGRRTYG